MPGLSHDTSYGCGRPRRSPSSGIPPAPCVVQALRAAAPVPPTAPRGTLQFNAPPGGPRPGIFFRVRRVPNPFPTDGSGSPATFPFLNTLLFAEVSERIVNRSRMSPPKFYSPVGPPGTFTSPFILAEFAAANFAEGGSAFFRSTDPPS